jgi:hypothetical protein
LFQIFDVDEITIIHKLLNENVCGLVDFALPTKPPSTSIMPTSKEYNVAVVMVQAFDHESFTLPNQNVTALDKQTQSNNRGKNMLEGSKIMLMGASVTMHMKSNHHVDTTKR